MPEVEFGVLLRRLRRDAGLTIEGLAELSGVSARGIGNLERGERMVPQRRTVAALADALRLDEIERALLLGAARAGRARRGIDDNPAGAGALPRMIDDFVGREAELARLSVMVEQIHARGSSQPVVVVSGAPGVGKTTLALRAAGRLGDRFPDGQLLVDLRGMDDEPPDWPELMLRVLKILGVGDRDLAQSGPQGHPELYRRVLAERRLLLVLDNARDEAQVRPLLPGSGEGMVLVTSRRMLTGLENVHRLQMGELHPRDSAVLLTGLVGVERAQAEPEALAEVAELCGHLPLALRVAGNWLTTRSGWTVRRLADRLASEERRLDALAVDDPGVTAAFDLSYRQLTPEAARLFRRLTLVEGPDVGAACAATLVGQTVFDTEDVLEELVEAGLLIGSAEGRYSFHDLVRLFARRRLEAEESASDTAAKTTMHRWLLETTVTAGRWYEPDHGAPPPTWRGTVDLSSADKAREWLQAEGANWLAALRAAATAEDHATVVEVAEALHWFSDQWIFWGHWPEVFSMAADSAQALADPLWEATHLNYHAWALILCEGRPQDGFARSVEAREAAQRAGSSVQQAWSHYYSAWALRNLEDYSEAAYQAQSATRLFEAMGDVHGTLQAMTAHGHIAILERRAADAVKVAENAFDFLDRAGDRVAPHIRTFTQQVLQDLAGAAYALMDRWDEAITHFRTGIALCRESGNAGMESRALVHLGNALLSVGRTGEARDAFTRCLDLGADADPDFITEARDHLDQLSDP